MHDSNPSPGELSGILESYKLPIEGVEKKRAKKIYLETDMKHSSKKLRKTMLFKNLRLLSI